jgi:hypothetical protein
MAISNDIQSTAIRLKGSVMTALYETDLVAWAREQADLARRGSVNSLDLAHIVEELGGMVRAEHRALGSQIERLMADSPSLAGELPRLIEVEWPRAVRWANDETRIVRRAFPTDCPWTQAELLDPDFLPDG